MRSIEVLMVENDPADVDLTKEALSFRSGRPYEINLSVVEDGEEAMSFLRKEGAFKDAARPDLVLLDLNMPRKDGREVLKDMRSDDRFRSIPVLVLTTSSAEEDVITSYRLGANSYITKAEDFKDFQRNMQTLEDYWFHVATLPPK